MDANQNLFSDLDPTKVTKNGQLPSVNNPNASKKSYFQITSVHEDIAPSHVLKEKSESREDIDLALDNSYVKEDSKFETLFEGKPSAHPNQNSSNFISVPAPSIPLKSSVSTTAPPRFKVVKIPSQVPYKKGRWTCIDSPFTSSVMAPSPAELMLLNNKSIKKSVPNLSKDSTSISNVSQSNLTITSDKIVTNASTKSKLDIVQKSSLLSNQPSLNFNMSTNVQSSLSGQNSNYMVRDVLKNKNAHDILCSNLNFVNNTLYATTNHNIHEALTSDCKDPYHRPDSELKYENISSLNSFNIETSLYEESNIPLLSTDSKHYPVLSSQTSPSSAYFEDYWKNLKLESISEKFTGSLEELATSSNQAIDNKIELAMDLVKSHLRLAVKSEMDCLRERVRELTLINERLEIENSYLRSSRTPPDPLLLTNRIPTPIPSIAPSTAELTNLIGSSNIDVPSTHRTSHDSAVQENVASKIDQNNDHKTTPDHVSSIITDPNPIHDSRAHCEKGVLGREPTPTPVIVSSELSLSHHTLTLPLRVRPSLNEVSQIDSDLRIGPEPQKPSDAASPSERDVIPQSAPSSGSTQPGTGDNVISAHVTGTDTSELPLPPKNPPCSDPPSSPVITNFVLSAAISEIFSPTSSSSPSPSITAVVERPYNHHGDDPTVRFYGGNKKVLGNNISYNNNPLRGTNVFGNIGNGPLPDGGSGAIVITSPTTPIRNGQLTYGSPGSCNYMGTPPGPPSAARSALHFSSGHSFVASATCVTTSSPSYYKPVLSTPSYASPSLVNQSPIMSAHIWLTPSSRSPCVQQPISSDSPSLTNQLPGATAIPGRDEERNLNGGRPVYKDTANGSCRGKLHKGWDKAVCSNKLLNNKNDYLDLNGYVDVHSDTADTLRLTSSTPSYPPNLTGTLTNGPLPLTHSLTHPPYCDDSRPHSNGHEISCIAVPLTTFDVLGAGKGAKFKRS